MVLVGGLNTRNAIERTHTVLTKEFSFQLETKQLLSKRQDSSSLYDEDESSDRGPETKSLDEEAVPFMEALE